MTIKPNYVMAFAKTFAWIFFLVAVITGIVPYFQGKGLLVGDGLRMGTFAGILFGVFVAIVFTPREITWDDETIKIRALFPGSGNFTWRQLEAWSPYGRGTFLISFKESRRSKSRQQDFGRRTGRLSGPSFRSDFQERKHYFGLAFVQFALERETMLNQSQITNRRCQTALGAVGKLGHALHAQTLRSAAVAYLCR